MRLHELLPGLTFLQYLTKRKIGSNISNIEYFEHQSKGDENSGIERYKGDIGS